jgi:hypothetical protein
MNFSYQYHPRKVAQMNPTTMSHIGLLRVVTLRAADDVTAILQRFVAADSRNAERASQYIYLAQVSRFSYNRAGQSGRGQRCG